MSKARTARIDDLARALKALANPHRLAILRRLVGCCAPGTVCRGEARRLPCVGELGRDLGIVPSTVSHHLKELRAAGLVNMTRCGQNIECSVDAEAVERLAEFFSGLAAGDPGVRAKKKG
jgi:ArsR family transcriptional regulator